MFPVSIRIDIVLRRLTFANSTPTRRISAVKSSWDSLSEIILHLSSTFALVMGAARRRHGGLSATTTRAPFAQWLILWWMNALEALRNCHAVLEPLFEQGGSELEGLRRTSVRTLDAAMVEVSHALGVVLVSFETISACE